jgi:hypothetical protein
MVFIKWNIGLTGRLHKHDTYADLKSVLHSRPPSRMTDGPPHKCPCAPPEWGQEPRPRTCTRRRLRRPKVVVGWVSVLTQRIVESAQSCAHGPSWKLRCLQLVAAREIQRWLFSGYYHYSTAPWPVKKFLAGRSFSPSTSPAPGGHGPGIFVGSAWGSRRDPLQGNSRRQAKKPKAANNKMVVRPDSTSDSRFAGGGVLGRRRRRRRSLPDPRGTRSPEEAFAYAEKTDRSLSW